MNLFDSQIKGLEGLMGDVAAKVETLAAENERLMAVNQQLVAENALLTQMVRDLARSQDAGQSKSKV